MAVEGRDQLLDSLNKRLAEISDMKGYKFGKLTGTSGYTLMTEKGVPVMDPEKQKNLNSLGKTLNFMGFDYFNGELTIGDRVDAHKKIQGGLLRAGLVKNFEKTKKDVYTAEGIASEMSARLNGVMGGKSSKLNKDESKYGFDVQVHRDKKGKVDGFEFVPYKIDEKGNKTDVVGHEKKVIDKAFGNRVVTGRNMDKALKKAAGRFENKSKKIDRIVRREERIMGIQEWFGRRKKGYDEMKTSYNERKILRAEERGKARSGEKTKLRYQVDAKIYGGLQELGKKARDFDVRANQKIGEAFSKVDAYIQNNILVTRKTNQTTMDPNVLGKTRHDGRA